MDNKTLDAFKKAKDELLEVYKVKEQELKAMRKELVAVGLIADEAAPATRRPVMKGAGPVKTGKRGKKGGWTEKILAALASKAMPTGEIITAVGYTGANLSANLASIAKSGRIEKKGDNWQIKK